MRMRYMPDAICRFRHRELHGLKRLLAVFLSNRAWVRRFIGGHWERWWIDSPVASAIWMPVETCSIPIDARPGLGRGRPVCEDHQDYGYAHVTWRDPDA